MGSETVFTYGAPALKLGDGASGEIGYDLGRLGVTRALLLTDVGVRATGAPDRIAEQIRAVGVLVEVFDGVHVEPTDVSLRAAAERARELGPFDGFVAVGGGSTIDTAKAVNLLTSCAGDLMDYVNAPVGGGRAPESPLRPLVAVPTTTGTGSESTTVCVLDVLSHHVKAGISHERMRPTLAVVDPGLTLTQPATVTAASGMDVLCHALESYTARPYTDYEARTPEQRVPYCGANPIADLWCEKALRLVAGSLRRAVGDGTDRLARSDLAMAATFAGLGFGNAGVHLPHANAYPLAGHVRDFHPPGYPGDAPLLPHGMAVSLTAPEAFRFTFEASPLRHLHAAQLLAPEVAPGADAAGHLPTVLVAIMRDVGMPSGLAEVGFHDGDLPTLVAGSMAQQRLLSTSPRPVDAEELAGTFEGSAENW